jgi:hypothetical protein
LGAPNLSTAGGTSVGITGTNFTGATAVYFGTVAASFTYNSSTSITATSPPHAVGTVDVTVVTPSGVSATSSADQVSYTAAALPTVSSLGTTTGSTAGGTSVVITGTNFTGSTGVFFGGVVATSFTVTSGTSITATSPAQYAGTVDVTVATGRFRWSADKREAAQLVAEDELTNEEIAARLKIGLRTLYDWKSNPLPGGCPFISQNARALLSCGRSASVKPNERSTPSRNPLEM